MSPSVAFGLPSALQLIFHNNLPLFLSIRLVEIWIDFRIYTAKWLKN
jgi:hypothetical protein